MQITTKSYSVKRAFASILESDAYQMGLLDGVSFAGGEASIVKPEETPEYKTTLARIRQDEAHFLKVQARLAEEIKRFKTTYKFMRPRQKEREARAMIAKLDDLKARQTETIRLAAMWKIPLAGLWMTMPAGNDPK